MTIQIVKGCPYTPGVCKVCGNHQEDHKDVVDFDVDVDWGDQLYVCKTCMNIGATLLGYLNPDEAAAMRAEIEQMRSERDTATEDLETLQGRVDRMIEGAKAKKEAKDAKTQKAKVKS